MSGHAPVLPDPDVAKILGTANDGYRSRTPWLVAVAVLVLAGGAYVLLRSDGEARTGRYETETVTQGDLVVTVSATGTLEPTTQVDVGSELSGVVEGVFVDDNDRVAKDQVLARLDVSKLNDQIERSKAALASAEAKVLQAAATIKEARANLARLRELARLSAGKLPAGTELDAADATLARALADEADANAAVSEAKAALRSDETNLAKASIRSPIDGFVLKRKTEPGQTVAASFQTPVLFTLAENLSQMELQVNVDEADVGQVEKGQSATFTVDAYPRRKFPAEITRVGYGSETTDGVVTYETILTVDNDDLSLRPGMTATAEMVTAKRENVILVPNAALRFAPTIENETTVAPTSGGILSRLVPRPPVSAKRTAASRGHGDEQRVWILRDGVPAPTVVVTGATDGRSTEIVSGGLEPAMLVVTDDLGSSS